MANALPLLLLGGGALLLMSRKKKTEPTGGLGDLPSVGEDEPEEDEPPIGPGPGPGPGPGLKPPTPQINCPVGEEAVEVPPGSGNWKCIVSVKPVPMQEHELKPGSHTNLPLHARYSLNPPYLTPQTLITLKQKKGLVWNDNYDGIAVMQNNSATNKLVVAITEPGEYWIMAHDGGYEGVFIAEWFLKTKGL